MPTGTRFRAYLNPQPSSSEGQQRLAVGKFDPTATYVQSRGEDRADLIQSLRKGDAALVSDLFVLAKAVGRTDRRFSDMLEAKDEIHGRGAYIVEASTGHRSDDRKQWPAMRDRARKMFGAAVKKGRGQGKRQGYEYTAIEIERMKAIATNKRLKNWPEREAAMKRQGIKAPKRSWFYQHIVSKLDD